jgi:hypothetical protein
MYRYLEKYTKEDAVGMAEKEIEYEEEVEEAEEI